MGLAVRIDHPGFVVSDLDVAVEFFTDVLGFERIREGEINDPGNGDQMTRLFGVPSSARSRYAFVGLGDRQVELLEWHDVTQGNRALNSDLAGRHLAVVVTELPKVLATISAIAGTLVRDPNPRGFVYVALPFGLELQLIPQEPALVPQPQRGN